MQVHQRPAHPRDPRGEGQDLHLRSRGGAGSGIRRRKIPITDRKKELNCHVFKNFSEKFPSSRNMSSRLVRQNDEIRTREAASAA